MAESITPRKHFFLGDMCIVCGFSFVLIEKTSDGKENINKFYNNKLRLNKDRVSCIKKVTETSIDVDNCSNAGVCRKCYRTIETILKTDEKNNDAKQKIKDSVDRVHRTQILSLPSPRRKIITKRLLRSPENVSRPAKSLATVSYVSPVKIAPFRELGNKSIKQQCEISSVINIKNENEMIGYHIFC